MKLLYILPAVILLFACNRHGKPQNAYLVSKDQLATEAQKKGGGNGRITESFDEGNKRSYAAGEIKLSTGMWLLDGAVIGNSGKDKKEGPASLRLGESGTVTMLFNVRDVKGITMRHSLYGDDAPATWSVWYATDDGKTWQQLGKPVTTSANELKTATIPVQLSGPVRFQIRKTGGGRVNVDNFSIQGTVVGEEPGGTATRDDNMAMGNPSGATNSPQNKDNYLMVKPQYALSYNNSKGIPNWVSWHLSSAWRGNAERTNRFAADQALPSAFFKVMNSHYNGSGFDRGHVCPSDDRDGSTADNEATFLMTNMTPQAPNLNQQPWMWLEDYCRQLAGKGQELYIVAGGYGQGGEGSKGAATTIANGRITVPAHFWKVIVVLPVGADDLHRVNEQTRIIAVDMANTQSANAHNWYDYRTTVDQIEAATGYDLLSQLPKELQQVIEAKKDNVNVE